MNRAKMEGERALQVGEPTQAKVLRRVQGLTEANKTKWMNKPQRNGGSPALPHSSPLVQKPIPDPNI